VDDLVADAASRNMPRPTDDERRPERTLHVGETIAAPRTGRSLPRPSRLWAVVTGEDDDGFVANAQRVDSGEEIADMSVHLRETVGKVAIASLALELRVRQGREVNERIGDIGVEWFAVSDAALHEVDRPPCDLLIDQATLV
jgi:hypothetical protein